MARLPRFLRILTAKTQIPLARSDRIRRNLAFIYAISAWTVVGGVVYKEFFMNKTENLQPDDPEMLKETTEVIQVAK